MTSRGISLAYELELSYDPDTQRLFLVSLIDKNCKLATKFEGPHTIIQLYDNWAILKAKNGKQIKQNILNLKPFLAPPLASPSLSWAEVVKWGEGTDPLLFNGDEAWDAELAATISAVLNYQATLQEKQINKNLINAIKDKQPP